MAKGHNEEVEEVKEFLQVRKEKRDKEEVAVIFDGKQYSIRIPLRFADAAEIDPKVDRFIFKLLLPPPHSKGEPKLTGELVRG